MREKTVVEKIEGTTAYEVEVTISVSSGIKKTNMVKHTVNEGEATIKTVYHFTD